MGLYIPLLQLLLLSIICFNRTYFLFHHLYHNFFLLRPKECYGSIQSYPSFTYVLDVGDHVVGDIEGDEGVEVLESAERGEQVVVEMEGTQTTEVCQAGDGPEAVVLQPEAPKARVLLQVFDLGVPWNNNNNNNNNYHP